MAAGGIYDHVGGGFHRTAPTACGAFPHFEKMLYDNAQLVDIYRRCLSGDETAALQGDRRGDDRVFVRNLGGRGEGLLLAASMPTRKGSKGNTTSGPTPSWRSSCRRKNWRSATPVYGTGGEQNFELGHVLEIKQPVDEAAEEAQVPAVQLERQLAEHRQEAAGGPAEAAGAGADEKILAAWNGLMIRTLARAGGDSGKARIYQGRRKSRRIHPHRNARRKGRLYHGYAARQAKINAYLDDYAYLNEASLALHLATDNEKWANAARRLSDLQLSLFWDEQGKGCYFTSHHHEALLAQRHAATIRLRRRGTASLSETCCAWPLSPGRTITAFAPGRRWSCSPPHRRFTRRIDEHGPGAGRVSRCQRTGQRIG